MKPKTITIEGDEMLNRIVAPSGNSGKVPVPVSWVGCGVVVVKLQEPAPLKPVTTKSALDKVDLLEALKQKVIDSTHSYGEKAGFQVVVDLIEHGDYDLIREGKVQVKE